MPPPSQPTTSSSCPVQPAPQFLPLTALSQLVPSLQLPDPNNVYDQLKFYEGTPTARPASLLLTSQQMLRGIFYYLSPPPALPNHRCNMSRHHRRCRNQYQRPITSVQRVLRRTPARRTQPRLKAAANLYARRFHSVQSLNPSVETRHH